MTAKKFYLTKEGYKKLKEELDFLVNTKRKEIVERIQIAKSYGDISENSEYDSARSEQSFVEGRIKEIKNILKDAEIIKKKSVGKVDLGSKVVIEIDGQEEEYEIVGSSEADPLQNKISNESPLGQAILGKRVGEEVVIEAPRGRVTYKIKKII